MTAQQRRDFFSAANHGDTLCLSRTAGTGTGRSASPAGRGPAARWSNGGPGGPETLVPVSGWARGGPVRGDRRGVRGGRGTGVAPLQFRSGVRLSPVWCRCGRPAAGGAAALAGGDRRDRGQRGRCRPAASPDTRGCASISAGQRGGAGDRRVARRLVLCRTAAGPGDPHRSGLVRFGRRGPRAAGGRAGRGHCELGDQRRLVAGAGAAVVGRGRNRGAGDRRHVAAVGAAEGTGVLAVARTGAGGPVHGRAFRRGVPLRRRSWPAVLADPGVGGAPAT